MTDEELMRAVCNGDQSAYKAIVTKHLKPISHYAYRMLGSSRETEDIAQETFLRLWINATKWQPEKSSLTTWLHRITHNLCIDHLRKHSHVQTQESFSEEEAEPNRQQSFAQEGDRGAAEKLQRAFRELPENQRSALMLCHYQGFSNKEAAAIMAISVTALESAIARAKRALRERLVLDGIDATTLLEELH
jgi:RNA polymerase sigma-70 factor (ECF subfamily)